MEKILYIVRGIPGSGKSTFAKSLGGTHFETDMFFMKDGEYKFDISKIKEAHKWCQDSVYTAMLLNHTALLNNVIVVSNTFTQEWEMKPQAVNETILNKEVRIAIDSENKLIIMDRKTGQYIIYSDSVGSAIFKMYAAKIASPVLTK